MNANRFWHPMLLYDYPGFDFIIFDHGLVNNESPLILRAIISNEQSLRDRVHVAHSGTLMSFVLASSGESSVPGSGPVDRCNGRSLETAVRTRVRERVAQY